MLETPQHLTKSDRSWSNRISQEIEVAATRLTMRSGAVGCLNMQERDWTRICGHIMFTKERGSSWREAEALFGFTGDAFGKRCREAGAVPSIGTLGDAYDNAMAESFLATLEREGLSRRRFKIQAEAKMASDCLEAVQKHGASYARHVCRPAAADRAVSCPMRCSQSSSPGALRHALAYPRRMRIHLVDADRSRTRYSGAALWRV
jgi:hypothetical protein